MAGRPITRAYNAKIREHGGTGMILDRLASGEKFADVARSTGVSRPFLAFHLFSMPGGRAAVHVARCMASEAAARASLDRDEAALRRDGRGPTDALVWLESRGGFRQVGGSDRPSISTLRASPVSYQPERPSAMGLLHIAAMKKAAEVERLENQASFNRHLAEFNAPQTPHSEHPQDED